MERMKALRIHAGPLALEHIARHGLQPQDVRVIPGAAGGPKGLLLGPIDRFLFGQWLPQSSQPVHLVGASIGAWRLANACLSDSVRAFAEFEHHYIHQHYEAAPGKKRPSARQVSEQFGAALSRFYGGRASEILDHPRYRLHVVTARGRHILGREGLARTPVGYLGAFVANSLRRKNLGAWLERVVFSQPGAVLPFGAEDFRTRQISLSAANFEPALQASCSIPFVLEAVHDIPGAPPGAYWDGGITDYHLHLNYRADDGIVLYPHFQQAVVPGWLDKGLKWRHRPSAFLDRAVVLAPDPAWVSQLPNGKLPDRSDFVRYGNDVAARAQAWGAAVSEAQRLADELACWLEQPDPAQVLPL